MVAVAVVPGLVLPIEIAKIRKAACASLCGKISGLVVLSFYRLAFKLVPAAIVLVNS